MSEVIYRPGERLVLKFLAAGGLVCVLGLCTGGFLRDEVTQRNFSRSVDVNKNERFDQGELRRVYDVLGRSYEFGARGVASDGSLSADFTFLEKRRYLEKVNAASVDN